MNCISFKRVVFKFQGHSKIDHQPPANCKQVKQVRNIMAEKTFFQ